MFRLRVIFSLVLIGVTLVAVSACTQSKIPSDEPKETAASESGDGRSIGENSSEGFGLLRIPKVQNDLQLSEEQKVQILALSMEMRNTRFNMRKKLAAILMPEQIQRLKEIRLQVEGPAGMNTHEVAMALGLTRAQRMKLKALQDQIREDIEIIFQGVRGLTVDQRRTKIPEIVRKIQLIRIETTQEAIQMLTSRQREKYEEMQGKKLDLDPPASQP